MLCIMHYDSLHNPPVPLLADLARTPDGKLLSATAQHKRLQQVNLAHETFLRDYEYHEEELTDEKALREVRWLRRRIFFRVDFALIYLFVNSVGWLSVYSVVL